MEYRVVKLIELEQSDFVDVPFWIVEGEQAAWVSKTQGRQGSTEIQIQKVIDNVAQPAFMRVPHFVRISRTTLDYIELQFRHNFDYHPSPQANVDGVVYEYEPGEPRY